MEVADSTMDLVEVADCNMDLVEVVADSTDLVATCTLAVTNLLKEKYILQAAAVQLEKAPACRRLALALVK